MLASCGPIIHSSGLTGGKREASVGPGVGLGLIAVQPAGTEGVASVKSEGRVSLALGEGVNGVPVTPGAKPG